MTMNPEIKERWLAALRSGDYIQGKSRLTTIFFESQTDTHNRVERDCCLGVLCKVLDVPSDEVRNEENGIAIRAYQDRNPLFPATLYLPTQVQEAAGLEQNPSFLPTLELFKRFPKLREYIIDHDATATLAHLNDADVPFSLIADVIEAVL
jgi:hypothetical protein